MSNTVLSKHEPEKDLMVEFIRDMVRDIVQTTRKSHRDSDLNKNRSLLGNQDISKFDIEFVTESAKNLKKKALPLDQYKNLQNALIQSEQHINAFLKVDNAIHGLVRDLSGSSTQAKYASACCCCNISLGNSKACTALCKQAAPYLLAELESTSEPLLEVCAWTIGNLVNSSNKAFSILHAQDCIKLLINLAGNCSDQLLPTISYTCLNYIYAGDSVISSEDWLELGWTFANRFSEKCDANFLWVLALLSSKEELQDCLIHLGTVISDYLVQALIYKNESIEKVSAALRILANIASENSGNVADYLLKIEGENHFFNKLLSHQYIHIREETLWLLGNFYNHNQTIIQERIKSLIPSLSSLELSVQSVSSELLMQKM